MKNIVTSVIFFACMVQAANAKIWRVNNNTGIVADFTSVQAAIDAVTTLPGDTIHVEASANGYGNCNLSKKLVIIGPGYFLTETSPMVANPKTEANTNIAYVNGAYFYPSSKGSVIAGMYINSYCVIEDSLITLQRDYINGDIYFGDSYTGYSGFADTIRQNFITGGFRAGYSTSTSKYKGLLIYNNIIGGSIIDFSQNINNVDGYFINNSFVYYYSTGMGNPVGITSANLVFQNNIFGYVNFGSYQTSNVFFNNVCNGTGIPSGNNNVQNVDASATVYNDWTGNGAGFSSDSRYKLKSSSTPASNAGTLNSTTVDCGAFGGVAPYILSGMPNAPSIYSLTVPTQINSGTATMSISLSSASH